MRTLERVSGSDAATLDLCFQAVLNQKFTDCFVLVFLDTQAGKTVSFWHDCGDNGQLWHFC